jgi:hypothetical protein
LQTWEERVDAATSHLLHILNKGHAAASPASHEMAHLADSTRLKKHIALLCEKIIKGVRVPTSLTTTEVGGQTAPKSAPPPPPLQSKCVALPFGSQKTCGAASTRKNGRLGRAGGRLETIMEDTNATDASEMELGEGDVPVGSQFGALQSGALSTTIDMDAQVPLDDEFDDQPMTPREPPVKQNGPFEELAEEETPMANGEGTKEDE